MAISRTDLLEVPTIYVWPIYLYIYIDIYIYILGLNFKEYHQKIWPEIWYVATYLHRFWILKIKATDRVVFCGECNHLVIGCVSDFLGYP